MVRWLRQSTSVDIPIGPFLDQTDGFTAETGLTITQPDIRLKKNNGNWTQKNASQTLTHEENGWYEVTLDATDTNTLGLLTVAVHESGALPVWEHFMVIPAQVWDSYLASDLLQVDLTQWLGSAPNALASGRVDTSVGAMAAGTVTAAAIATDAIDADAIAANAIDASALAADAVSEIQSGLATSAALANVQSDTDDIQARLPASLSGGKMRSQVEGMDADTITATALAASAVSEIQSGLSTLTLSQIQTMIIEGSLTFEGVMRIILSATAGKSHSPVAGQRAYRDVADTKNRILAQVNQGDRTTVTLDPS